MTATQDLFAPLTEIETCTLLAKLRHGYKDSREATKMARDYFRTNVMSETSPWRTLLSARNGSLAGVRTDLTQACTDLINHLRILEMS